MYNSNEYEVFPLWEDERKELQKESRFNRVVENSQLPAKNSKPTRYVQIYQNIFMKRELKEFLLSNEIDLSVFIRLGTSFKNYKSQWKTLTCHISCAGGTAEIFFVDKRNNLIERNRIVLRKEPFRISMKFRETLFTKKLIISKV